MKYLESVISGFNLATQSGPLCAEPLAGIAVVIESYEFLDDSNSSCLPGQILSLMKDSIHKGFLQWSPRLYLAYYTCELQTEAHSLGRVDGVLSRRKGRIISEDIKEGTALFTLTARLPVVESFGFVDEILKRTSGLAQPQLVFSGFAILNQDPFWVPTTEEELEDLGAIAERENVAKRYMENIRERKGLPIEKKVVEFAEKQRTLKAK